MKSLRCLLLIHLIALAHPLQAIDRFVTSDQDDGGAGTLRNTVAAADPDDRILFDPSLAGATIYLTSGEIPIMKNLEINGLNPGGGITLSGSNLTRVFSISGSPFVTLKGLTITEGKAADSATAAQNGGGIYQSGGTLTLFECTVAGNSAGNGLDGNPGGGGGGIYSASGNIIIENSTVSDNTAGNGGPGNYPADINSDAGNGGDGGGIHGNGTNLTLYNSSITGNNAGDGGSTGYNASGAGGNGGGIYNIGPIDTIIISSTITGNSAGDAAVGNNGVPGGSGGGIYFHASASLNLDNSIIAENSAGGGGFGDGQGADVRTLSGVTAAGVCLIGNNDSVDTQFPAPGTSGQVNANGDFVGIPMDPLDPLLGPPAANGGLTLTRAPLPGSPAIDPPGGATSTGLNTDQRGGTRIVRGILDIGAVEDQLPVVNNSAEKRRLKRKIRHLERQEKRATRRGQRAKAKRLARKIKKLKRKLRKL